MMVLFLMNRASAFAPVAPRRFVSVVPPLATAPPPFPAASQTFGAQIVANSGSQSMTKAGSSSTALSALSSRVLLPAFGFGLAAIGGFLRSNRPVAAIFAIDMVAVAKFYKGYPIAAAFMTAACKAAIADRLAQYRDVCNTKFDLKRNLAMILYSGTTLGVGCEIMYNRIFPLMFGVAGPELDLVRVAKMTLFDGFVNAPLLWLWPAYLTQALVYGYPKRDGIKKYISDVRENHLLTKYWSLWLPVTTLNFCFVPPHFRIAFVAFVSFFWMIVLSLVSNSSGDVDSCPVEPEPVLQNPRALD